MNLFRVMVANNENLVVAIRLREFHNKIYRDVLPWSRRNGIRVKMSNRFSWESLYSLTFITAFDVFNDKVSHARPIIVSLD
jgi:hypothetical protein